MRAQTEGSVITAVMKREFQSQKIITLLLVERACRARLLKCSRFFFLSDLVCRPRVPNEDRGNWGYES